jgi:hypothetical protein
MEQSTQTTQTTNNTTTKTKPTAWRFEDSDEDDFDLIEFGIASNGGRLSIKRA